ncbi:MAG: hypothetical protein RIS79_4060 [Verrucomicrobiota bacterium]
MKPQLPITLTLLPPPEDRRGEVEIIEEWARGLDWVRWLLGSVRARTDHLCVNGSGWQGFTEGVFRETLAPALERGWSAAHAGDLQALIRADAELSSRLPAAENERSRRAGAILLKSTHKARYQGVLGHFRDQIAAGRCDGHLSIVWAAVGNFFHLSLANVIAEYLRLEWEIGTRHDLKRREPNFGLLTREVLFGRMREPRAI